MKSKNKFLQFRKKTSLSKVIFIFTLPFLMDVFVACCSCDEPYFYNYSHCDLSVMNLDNSGSDVGFAEDEVIKEAYGIRLQMNRSSALCEKRKVRTRMTSSAFAMHCDCSSYNHEFVDNIRYIKIFTLRPFDEEHPAQSEITDYFSVFRDNDFYSVHRIGVLNNQFSSATMDVLSFDLLLMNAPQNSATYSFRIEVTLTDDRVFVEETDPITLL